MKILLALLVMLRVALPPDSDNKTIQEDPLAPEGYYIWEEEERWDPVMDYGHEIFEDEQLELEEPLPKKDKEYL